jgi:O-antigen/teichoic acid export membrane protein
VQDWSSKTAALTAAQSSQDLEDVRDGMSTEATDPVGSDPAERRFTALSAVEIRERAASGVFLLVGRSLLLKGIGLASNLVLARLLLPEDFGVVALGMTIIAMGSFVSDAGLGVGLVRRPEPPTLAEMRAITGFQLLGTSLVGGAAAGIGLLLGGSGSITALMMLALPLGAFRTPAMIYLDRQMQFEVKVRVEVVETLAYATVAIALAAAGVGAWSIASATVISVLVGNALLSVSTPFGFKAPSLDFAAIRPLLGFGLALQGVGAIHLAHDVALVSGITAVSGLTVLGLWALTMRVLQIPMLLYEAVYNVSFPAYARLSETDEDIGPIIERSVTALAVSCGMVLTVVGGSAYAAIPLIFGDRWQDAAVILPGACLALAVAAPVNIGMLSFLTARGDIRTPLIAALIGGPVRLVSSLAGLAVWGVAALGFGWLVGALVELPVVVRRAQEATGRRLVRRFAAPALATALGIAAGWGVAMSVQSAAAGTVLSAIVAFAMFAVSLALLDAPALTFALSTLRRSAGAARRRYGHRRRPPDLSERSATVSVE